MLKRTNTAVWLEKYNRWQINVQKDGVRKTFSSSKKGRVGQREANHKADLWLELNVVQSNIKVSKLSERYLEEKKLNVGRSRYETVRSMFTCWINKYIGNKQVRNLNEQDLQNILNQMYKKGLSYWRIRETRVVICDFIRFARKLNITKLYPEYLTVNKNAYRGERNILQPHEIKILMTDSTTKYNNRIEDDPYVTIYRLAIITGMRRGEILGLRWDDIDRENKLIHINRSLNQYLNLTGGKTKNTIRTIPLTDISEKLLFECNIRKERKGFLFQDITPGTLTYRYKKYAEYHGFKATRFHELRHTFISITDGDIPINILKDIVGHSKNMNTVGVYGHSVDGEMMVANEKINSRFAEILNTF